MYKWREAEKKLNYNQKINNAESYKKSLKLNANLIKGGNYANLKKNRCRNMVNNNLKKRKPTNLGYF